MRFSHQQKHVIDLLFPIALFFVFALSALTVILLATHVYQETTAESSLNYTAQTSLSYIREKISQADADGGVSLTTLDGQDALCLRTTQDGSTYYTYIYALDGELRELFVSADTDTLSAAAGRSILPVQSFTMETVADDLYAFTCISTDNETARTVIAVRSHALS